MRTDRHHSIHLGVFDDEARLMNAVRESRGLGLEILDVRSPYPIHGLDDIAGIPRSRLPIACFIGGAVGLGLSLWFQYWANTVDWPVNIGGKPMNSLPAFAPVAFEITVLLAGLTVVFGLLIRSGLCPTVKAPPDLGTTDDRFALFVVRPDASVSDEQLRDLWRRNGALRTDADWSDERWTAVDDPAGQGLQAVGEEPS